MMDHKAYGTHINPPIHFRELELEGNLVGLAAPGLGAHSCTSCYQGSLAGELGTLQVNRHIKSMLGKG